MATDDMVVDPPITTQPQDDDPNTVTPSDPAAQTNIKPVNHHVFTFPPFPRIPEGVVIIPFSKFKETGILIEGGPDGDEIDSFGIPTVPMEKRHHNDVCKTKATKRKGQWDTTQGRKKKKGFKGGAEGPAATWWEVWEDGELARWATSHDPNSTRCERLNAACSDFTEKRHWPVQTKQETGPKYVWDKFRVFIGASDTATVRSATQRKKRRKIFGVDSDDEFSSDEEGDSKPEDLPDGHEDGGGADKGPKIEKQANTGIIDEAILRTEKQRRRNEEKMYTFLDDPEKSLRIFMSSYSRRIGLHWSEDNLEIIPRLLRFFVNFLLRSKVIPEIGRELNKSLAIIEKALVELPASSAISKCLPDKFNIACRSSWGTKAESLHLGGDWPQAVETVDLAESGTTADNTGGWGEGDAGSVAVADVPSGWGDAPTNDNPWDKEPEWMKETEEEITRAEKMDVELWAPVEINLLSLLGPTTFLLTHKAGVVERSLRLIKAVIPPGTNIPPDIVQTAFSLESPAVELQLERRFTKVVLGTSEIGWDGGESQVYTRPEILSTSQGPVIDSDATDGATPPEVPPGGTPAHNPLKDDITLLVDKDAPFIKDLHIGMGLGGTWVQIARDVLPVKKKGKKLKPAPSMWYVSDLNMVIPSFWDVPATTRV